MLDDWLDMKNQTRCEENKRPRKPRARKSHSKKNCVPRAGDQISCLGYFRSLPWASKNYPYLLLLPFTPGEIYEISPEILQKLWTSLENSRTSRKYSNKLVQNRTKNYKTLRDDFARTVIYKLNEEPNKNSFLNVARWGQ